LCIYADEMMAEALKRIAVKIVLKKFEKMFVQFAEI
jgi:hypothetical protein